MLRARGITCRAIVATVALSTGACRPTRPPAPPVGPMPWGTFRATSSLGTSSSAVFEPAKDGRLHFSAIALSGGGSYGAYGAGLMCGWSASGRRPRFAVVTGVSTGALMATAVFLGAAYDDMLRQAYTTVTTSELYSRNSIFTVPGRGALARPKGLDRLIARFVDERVLDAVAAEYVKGRRLFVSTTDLDQGRIVFWDLGAIACSRRPDRLQRYRKVLRAASAVPVFFPPVYLPVHDHGRSYGQMNTDTISQGVFLRESMLRVAEHARAAGVDPARVDVDVYVLVNMQLDATRRRPVSPTIEAIGDVLGVLSTEPQIMSGVYRIYLLAQARGYRFRLTSLPNAFDLRFGMLTFDRPGMRQLFRAGYNAAAHVGPSWQSLPPGVSEPAGACKQPRS